MQFESSEHDLRSRQVHEKRESVLSLHKEEYFEKYGDKYQAFKEKYNEFDDGKASENIIKLIENSK